MFKYLSIDKRSFIFFLNLENVDVQNLGWLSGHTNHKLYEQKPLKESHSPKEFVCIAVDVQIDQNREDKSHCTNIKRVEYLLCYVVQLDFDHISAPRKHENVIKRPNSSLKGMFFTVEQSQDGYSIGEGQQKHLVDFADGSNCIFIVFVDHVVNYKAAHHQQH